MKDLLRTQDLSRDDIEMLLATATEFASNPLRSRDALANKSVAIYMTKPSTRTRLASETAVAHSRRNTDLSYAEMTSNWGAVKQLQIPPRIISGYCSAMIVRTFAQSDVDELGAHATIPVINASHR
jgi:ornithine carbamoyltransferase